MHNYIYKFMYATMNTATLYVYLVVLAIYIQKYLKTQSDMLGALMVTWQD